MSDELAKALGQYRPNPVADYFDERANEHSWNAAKAGVAAPAFALMALMGTPSPGASVASRVVGRGLQAGAGALSAFTGGFGIPHELSRASRASDAAKMWRSTGLPGRPDT